MNFEEAYNHFIDGTASEEEITFVREELRRARDVQSILDRAPATEDIFNSAENSDIMRARKRFNFRSTVRMIIVVLLSLIVLAGAICGYIFGTAIPAAKKNSRLSEQEALSAASEYLSSYLNEDVSEYQIHDVDRDLYCANGLKSCVYRYEIEFRNEGIEYEVSVNAASGYCRLIDIDYH